MSLHDVVFSFFFLLHVLAQVIIILIILVISLFFVFNQQSEPSECIAPPSECIVPPIYFLLGNSINQMIATVTHNHPTHFPYLKLKTRIFKTLLHHSSFKITQIAIRSKGTAITSCPSVLGKRAQSLLLYCMHIICDFLQGKCWSKSHLFTRASRYGIA